MADEKKQGSKKAPAKKAPAKKAAARKAPAEKAAKRKKPAAKKPATEKAAGKKAPAKEKAPARAAPKKEAAKKEPPKLAPLMVRASSRYVRVAPRKARLVADQVRGLHIDRARALLRFSPRSAAQDIHKLIESAAANAENNHDLDSDEMKVAEITVDEGPTLRRFRPRALGRATPINKRTSHIAVALSPEEER
jgi:large subunit ribosomal protein L22